MIEVEKRARLQDKAQYEALAAKLQALASIDLGENNTDSIFYLHRDWQLKVQRQISKGTAKIAWKSGGVNGAHSREEIDFTILPEQYDEADVLVKNIVGAQVQRFETSQLRHDYELDGVEIALKYSDSWGYHVELEKTVFHASSVEQALAEITSVAETLGVSLLSEEEEKEFVEKTIEAHLKKR